MKKFMLLMACVAILCSCGGGESKSQPQEESKQLPASSLTLKGKHASMFKVSGDTYTVRLVNTDDGWQIRVKVNLELKTSYTDLRDCKLYEQEMSSVYGNLLNSSDVEISSLDVTSDDWDALVMEEAGAEGTISMKTYSYHHYGYEEAKAMFDKVVSVELTGIELKEAKKSSSGSSSILDDDTRDAMQDAKELIEMEGQLLNALGGLL